METSNPGKPKGRAGRPSLNIVPYAKAVKFITVEFDNGERLRMPADQIAAAEECKIMAVQVAEFFKEQMEKLKQATLQPKEIQDIVTAAQRVDALLRTQYTEVASGQSVRRDANDVLGIVEKAARGAAEGAANSLKDKFKQMEEAGKPKKVEPIGGGIEVVVEDVK